MDIEVKQKEPAFKPVTITITAKTIEEVRLLRKLFQLDETVPQAVYEETSITINDRDVLSEMFNTVSNQLCHTVQR